MINLLIFVSLKLIWGTRRRTPFAKPFFEDTFESRGRVRKLARSGRRWVCCVGAAMTIIELQLFAVQKSEFWILVCTICLWKSRRVNMVTWCSALRFFGQCKFLRCWWHQCTCSAESCSTAAWTKVDVVSGEYSGIDGIDGIDLCLSDFQTKEWPWQP